MMERSIIIFKQMQNRKRNLSQQFVPRRQNSLLHSVLIVVCFAMPLTGQDFQWAQSIVATSDGIPGKATFGFHPDATDGYDDGLDNYLPPGACIFPEWFCLYITYGGDAYLRQILGSTDEQLVWGLTLQYPNTGASISLSWDRPALDTLCTEAILVDPFNSLFVELDLRNSSPDQVDDFAGYLDVTDPDHPILTMTNDLFTHLDLIVAASGLSASIDFCADVQSGIAPLTVTFTPDTESYPYLIGSWYWDLVDGTTSSEEAPQHTYEFPGAYTISLTVETQWGGYTSTETKENYITITGIGLDDTNPFPNEFALHQNYPNPFNAVTTVNFITVETLHATSLQIYDVSGRLVETLVNEKLEPGYHEVNWDATNVSSGVYIYRLITHQKQITRKMVVLK